MPMNAGGIKAFLEANPALASALLGGATGGTIGSAFSDYGEESRGALQGALLGSMAGAAGGKLFHSVAKRVPSPEGSLFVGSLAGGTLGGMAGKRSLSPWVLHRLAGEQGQKEAAVSGSKEEMEKKAAMEKEAADRIQAFDYGMSLLMANGCPELDIPAGAINRDEFIKRANAAGADVTNETLAESAMAWLSDQLQEAK